MKKLELRQNISAIHGKYNSVSIVNNSKHYMIIWLPELKPDHKSYSNPLVKPYYGRKFQHTIKDIYIYSSHGHIARKN
jgi:hypothetical protein